MRSEISKRRVKREAVEWSTADEEKFIAYLEIKSKLLAGFAVK